jgi:hypothetical protein
MVPNVVKSREGWELYIVTEGVRYVIVNGFVCNSLRSCNTKKALQKEKIYQHVYIVHDLFYTCLDTALLCLFDV